MKGKPVTERFRNTDAGRAEAAAFAKTLTNPITHYDVRIRVSGRDTSKTFRSKKAAENYVTKMEYTKLDGIVVDPRDSRTKLREYSNRWLESRNLAERTVELYEYLLDSYVLPTFADVPVGSISTSTVRVWNARLKKEHPTTAAKAYRLLASMMNTAVEDEVLGRNPCRIKGASDEVAPERLIPTVAEVEAMADAMPKHLRIAVLLAAWCRLRRGELLGLRRRDIDLIRKKISIEVTRTPMMNGRIIQKDPKSEKGKRRVDIAEDIVSDLRSHLQEYVGSEPDAPVIVGKKGAAVTPAVLQAAWNKARTAVGRPDLHLHDLRHFGLTMAAVEGATTRELMHLEGHSSPSASLRYQHLAEDRGPVIAEALSKLRASATVTNLDDARDRRGMSGVDVQRPNGGQALHQEIQRERVTGIEPA